MKSKAERLGCILIGLILCACGSNSDLNEAVKKEGISQENSFTVSPTLAPTVISQEICNEERAEAYVLSMSKDKEDKALRKYQLLIESGCYSDLLYLQYAHLLASREDFEGANNLYRFVVKRDPNNWYAHWSLAQNLIINHKARTI